MKEGIHPPYHKDAKISCACGKVHAYGSTQETIAIELCSACHPFFTGKQRIVDSARRVEKFAARGAKKSESVKTSKDKAADRKARADRKSAKRANDVTIKSVRS